MPLLWILARANEQSRVPLEANRVLFDEVVAFSSQPRYFCESVLDLEQRERTGVTEFRDKFPNLRKYVRLGGSATFVMHSGERLLTNLTLTKSTGSFAHNVQLAIDRGVFAQAPTRIALAKPVPVARVAAEKAAAKAQNPAMLGSAPTESAPASVAWLAEALGEVGVKPEPRLAKDGMSLEYIAKANLWLKGPLAGVSLLRKVNVTFVDSSGWTDADVKTLPSLAQRRRLRAEGKLFVYRPGVR